MNVNILACDLGKIKLIQKLVAVVNAVLALAADCGVTLIMN